MKFDCKWNVEKRLAWTNARKEYCTKNPDSKEGKDYRKNQKKKKKLRQEHVKALAAVDNEE